MRILGLNSRTIAGTNKIEKENKRIVFALCCIIFIPSLNNFWNSFFQIGLSLETEFLTPVSYIFMALVSVFVLYKYIFRRKIYVFAFLFFLLGTIISYFLYSDIRSAIYASPVDLVYSPVNKLFYFCIPAWIGASCLTNYNSLFRAMRGWGRFSVFTGVVTYVFVLFITGKNLQYMVFSYFMLLPICVCYEHSRVNKSKIDLLLAVVGTVAIIMCGARGAVISLIMYFVVRIMFTGVGKLSIGKVLVLFLSLFLIVIFLTFYEELLMMISDLLKSFGVESRFLTYLIQGTLLNDTGRSTIAEAVFNGIMNNPLGYGLYGDRYVVGTYGFYKYVYSHCIVTELLCDFGLIGGSLLLLIIAFGLLKQLIFLKDKKEIGLILALLPYGMFQLLFSSSFLENTVFFVIIGLCFFAKAKETDQTRIGDSI